MRIDGCDSILKGGALERSFIYGQRNTAPVLTAIPSNNERCSQCQEGLRISYCPRDQILDKRYLEVIIVERNGTA